MAELMNASLLRDGVVQGCALSVSGNELNIASGRIVVGGRLAVVSAGTIARPSDITSTQKCYVCAECDLSLSEPFNISIYKQAQYDSLVDRVSLFKNGTFNVNDGTAMFVLGTVQIDPSIGVTSVSQSANYSAKNIDAMTVYDEKIADAKKAATDLKTTVDSHTERFKALGDYVNKRAHSSTKFMRWNIAYPHVTIAANSKVTVTMKPRYGTTYTWSGNSRKESNKYKDIEKKYDSSAARDSFGYRQSIRSFDEYGTQFLTPISIGGLLLSNSSFGGKGHQHCSVTGWRFTSTEIKVDVYNDNKEAAVIDILVSMLYVQRE
jgi:hypothetical protein